MDAKSRLLDLLRMAYEEEMNFNATLNDEERSVSGSSDNWAIKDVIVHNSVWKVIMSERFIASMSGSNPRSYDDYDAENEKIYQRHREDSWESVVKFQEGAYSQLVEQVELAAEDDLVDPDRFAWLKGRSLLKQTFHNGYFHPLWHLALLIIERGEGEPGFQMMEEVTRISLTLDESPTWQGQSLYNLACFYALSGKKDKSLENLSQAFSLSLDMIEWSKEDTDLASLWDEPGFLALVDRSEG
jgi:hypothetical protein